MSSGARLSIVCVSDLLVQPERSHLLYAAGRQSHVCCSFEKRHATFFQKRFLKFSDFPRNHNEIYFLGKCYIKLVGFKMIHINISKNENPFPRIIKKGPMAFAIRPFPAILQTDNRSVYVLLLQNCLSVLPLSHYNASSLRALLCCHRADTVHCLPYGYAVRLGSDDPVK